MSTPEETQIIGAICSSIQVETNRLVEWTEKITGGYTIRIFEFENIGYTGGLRSYIEFVVTPAMLSGVDDVTSLRFLVDEILLATRLKGGEKPKKRQPKTEMEKRWSGKWNG